MFIEIARPILENCPLFSTISNKGCEITNCEVKPYNSISDILALLNVTLHGELPVWIKNTKSIAQSTDICCFLSQQVYGEEREFCKRSEKPRTLVCHDYKGNYHAFDSKFSECSDSDNKYEFTHWMGIDIFVYFSHHFITIPPPYWINQAHKHGVAVLGTLITESKEGKELCDEIFESDVKWRWFAEALNAVALIHKFDGYLINIENPLSATQVLMMVDFLRYLRNLLPKTSFLIWYDAVTVDGKLSWQDALNEHNEAFFNACDGIFLNYGMTAEKLNTSVLTAGKRNHDVYVGVDVFGRSEAPGRFATCDAFKMARNLNLSVAVFAPGWTIEASPGGSPLTNDYMLWTSIRPYLYFHGVMPSLPSRNTSDVFFCTPPPPDSCVFQECLRKMIAMDNIKNPDEQLEVANSIYSILPPPILSSLCQHKEALVFKNCASSYELQLLVLEILVNKQLAVQFINEYSTYYSIESPPSFFITFQDRKKNLKRIVLNSEITEIDQLGTIVEFGVACHDVPTFCFGKVDISFSEDRSVLTIVASKVKQQGKLELIKQ